MNRKILEEALLICKKERGKNTEKALNNIAYAVSVCPEIGVLMEKRRSLIFDSVYDSFIKQNEKPNLVEENEKIKNKIEKLLEEQGLSKNFLEPIYSCKLCKDTGYIGDPKKEICSCVKSYYSSLINTYGKSVVSQQTFEHFNEHVFPNDKPLDGSQVTQRNYMLLIRKRCEKYADELPAPEKRNMLLYGLSGLGKTFLLNCIHNRAIERNIQSVCLTANMLLDMIRKHYFSFEDSSMDIIRDSELLLIDDLGTEPLWENITIEQLFSLFDYRLRNEKCTVISTNLSLTDLQSRYSERISSRLFEKKSCELIKFLGVDLRRI